MIIELDLKKLLLFSLIFYGILVIFDIVDSIVESIIARFGCLGVLAIWIIGIPFVYWSLTGKTTLFMIVISLFGIFIFVFLFLILIVKSILYNKRKKREKEVERIIEEHKANR